MRVLFVVRPDLEVHRGGDTTQILSTARELEVLGVQIEIAHAVPPGVAGFDLVHMFHLDRLWENVPHLRAVRGIRPVVLSPIWWPKDDYNAHSRQGIQGSIARIVGTRAFDPLRLFVRSIAAFRARPSAATIPRPSMWMFERRCREMLGSASMVLPNSMAEVHMLEAHFGAAFRYEVIPNGIDPVPAYPARGPVEEAEARGGERIDVLCVARIEPRKNQHKIIDALGDTGLKVVFAGTSGEYSRDYEQQCHEAATKDVMFLGAVPRDELPALYRSARVHVLPSWFETPGLSSLEAAGHGCPVVVGDCEAVREYFGDHATYCDPGSVEAIREAVMGSLDAPRDGSLAQIVADRYTWPVAARATLDAYEKALVSWSDA